MKDIRGCRSVKPAKIISPPYCYCFITTLLLFDKNKVWSIARRGPCGQGPVAVPKLSQGPCINFQNEGAKFVSYLISIIVTSMVDTGGKNFVFWFSRIQENATLVRFSKSFVFMPQFFLQQKSEGTMVHLAPRLCGPCITYEIFFHHINTCLPVFNICLLLIHVYLAPTKSPTQNIHQMEMMPWFTNSFNIRSLFIEHC